MSDPDTLMPETCRDASALQPEKTPQVAAPSSWSMHGQPLQLVGFAYGLAYPSVSMVGTIPATTPSERAELAERFYAMFEGCAGLARLDPFADPALGDERQDTVIWFCALAARLQQLADLPVSAAPIVTGNGTSAVSLAIPTLSRGLEPTATLLILMCRVFAAPQLPGSQLIQQAQIAFSRLRASALTTSNTPRFVKAAVASGIVFQELPGSMVQYGIGRKSVLMDSTFTHFCSNTGARLAKFKHWGANMLQRAGLPAPRSAIAANLDEALTIAENLGYPVVVKPADRDGGIAVQADLRNPDEVTKAFEIAAKASKMVMVEKFIAGRDYRITVFRGKAIWAVERVPGGVTGDGASTIQELVDIANSDPRRGSTIYSALKKLKLDREAQALLERDGLTVGSIPADGEFVRLRRSSNVTNGGMPIVATERMHPDNARLAERAANTIGLDLCGVDLIIPDIATSWREVEAGICEVNAQPELGGVTVAHLYPQILKALVKGDGHVPTIAVLGGEEAGQLAAKLAASLTAQGICVGSHDHRGVHVGRETIIPGPMSSLHAGRALTMDRRVEAIVLGAFDPMVITQGLPVRQIDVLLVTGKAPDLSSANRFAPLSVLVELLRAMLPHCRAVSVLEPKAGMDPVVQAALRHMNRAKGVIPAEQQSAALTNLVKGVATAALAARKPAVARNRANA